MNLDLNLGPDSFSGNSADPHKLPGSREAFLQWKWPLQIFQAIRRVSKIKKRLLSQFFLPYNTVHRHITTLDLGRFKKKNLAGVEHV